MSVRAHRGRFCLMLMLAGTLAVSPTLHFVLHPHYLCRVHHTIAHEPGCANPRPADKPGVPLSDPGAHQTCAAVMLLHSPGLTLAAPTALEEQPPVAVEPPTLGERHPHPTMAVLDRAPCNSPPCA